MCVLPRRVQEEQNDRITSPMPGKVVKIPVSVGQEMKAGETVIVIEAMKMQSNYKVTSDCRSQAEIEEEWRLVYVGITLCKEKSDNHFPARVRMVPADTVWKDLVLSGKSSVEIFSGKIYERKDKGRTHRAVHIFTRLLRHSGTGAEGGYGGKADMEKSGRGIPDSQLPFLKSHKNRYIQGGQNHSRDFGLLVEHCPIRWEIVFPPHQIFGDGPVNEREDKLMVKRKISCRINETIILNTPCPSA